MTPPPAPSTTSAASTARILYVALSISAGTLSAIAWLFRGALALPDGTGGAVTFAAYALAVSGLLAGLAFRRRFPGSTALFYLAVASLIVPSVLVSLGIGLMFRMAGIEDFHALERVGERAWMAYDKSDAGLWELRTRSHVHTYSAAMCWASAALPPLPQRRILPSRR